MIRIAVPMALVLALCGCAGATERDGGLATYDALNQVQAACAAKGGTLQLKPNGDPQQTADYACERK